MTITACGALAMTIQPNPAPLSPTKDPEKKKKDTFLESSNLLFVKEHPAGSRKPYWFEPDNIRDEKRETFLILGFDTEYKTPPEALIPNPIDQYPCAHSRRPMDMMRQG